MLVAEYIAKIKNSKSHAPSVLLFPGAGWRFASRGDECHAGICDARPEWLGVICSVFGFISPGLAKSPPCPVKILRRILYSAACKPFFGVTNIAFV